jgi:hypothetical protein
MFWFYQNVCFIFISRVRVHDFDQADHYDHHNYGNFLVGTLAGLKVIFFYYFFIYQQFSKRSRNNYKKNST